MSSVFRADPDFQIETRHMSGKNNREYEAERNLIAAMLLQAQEEYTGLRINKRGYYEEASTLRSTECEVIDLRFWVEHDSDEAYSFRYCCETLDIDCDAARRRLMWLRNNKILLAGKMSIWNER